MFRTVGKVLGGCVAAVGTWEVGTSIHDRRALEVIAVRNKSFYLNEHKVLCFKKDFHGLVTVFQHDQYSPPLIKGPELDSQLYAIMSGEAGCDMSLTEIDSFQSLPSLKKQGTMIVSSKEIEYITTQCSDDHHTKLIYLKTLIKI
jgi:hypothetical protein